MVKLKFSTTVCPRSSEPFHIVSYYIKWVTTSDTQYIHKLSLMRTVYPRSLNSNRSHNP